MSNIFNLNEFYHYVDHASPEEKMHTLLYLLQLLTNHQHIEHYQQRHDQIIQQVNSTSTTASSSGGGSSSASGGNITGPVTNRMHVNTADLNAEDTQLSDSISYNNSNSLTSLSNSFTSHSKKQKSDPIDFKHVKIQKPTLHEITTTMSQHVNTFLSEPFVVDTVDSMANKCAIKKTKRKRGRPKHQQD